MTWKVVLGNPEAQRTDDSASSQAKEPMVHGKTVRVLVVDDEPSICKALTMALVARWLRRHRGADRRGGAGDRSE